MKRILLVVLAVAALSLNAFAHGDSGGPLNDFHGDSGGPLNDFHGDSGGPLNDFHAK